MRLGFSIVFIFIIHFSSWACDEEHSRSELAKLTWVTEDYPPYNYLDQNSELKGIFTDILLLVYQELGIEITKENIDVIPWARLYQLMTYEKGVAAFSMTNTTERSKRFKLIPLPYKDKISIMVKKDRKNELINKKLENLTIAVVREDIGHHLLNHHDIPSVQVHTTSAYSMLKMLVHNRVDAIAYGEDVAYFQFNKLGFGSDSILPLYVLEKEKVNSYIFHRNTNKCVVETFSNTIDSLHRQGRLDDVFAKYLKTYERPE